MKLHVAGLVLCAVLTACSSTAPKQEPTPPAPPPPAATSLDGAPDAVKAGNQPADHDAATVAVVTDERPAAEASDNPSGKPKKPKKPRKPKSKDKAANAGSTATANAGAAKNTGANATANTAAARTSGAATTRTAATSTSGGAAKNVNANTKRDNKPGVPARCANAASPTLCSMM